MGNVSLLSLASPISRPSYNAADFPGSGAARTLLPQTPAPQQDVAALVQPNQALALTEAYESAVYRSLESRQSLSLQLSRLGASQGDGAAGIGFEANQLTFDFFKESRFEEVALFNQRTDAVGDGLDSARKTSFFAAREEIATRFQLSFSVSGAALNGFAGTAEGAADSNALIDKLLGVTDQLLGQANEFLGDFFSLLDGSDGTFSAESIEALFKEFVEEASKALASLDLSGGTSGTGNGKSLQSSTVQLEFSFEFSASFSSQQVVVEQGDPIVLDLDGDGIELSRYQDGARFDLIGSGEAQQVAFVQGGDAFLALDRNNDGLINSGLELFGEQHGARNGFEELRTFDDNGDGRISRSDAIYESLRLFRDNGNGITEAGELIGLADGGVEEIDLGYRDTDERAAGGNRITQVASFLRSNGDRGTVADALLNYIA